ncbi:MAG TPA: DEAD/DEAH box helicase [Catalimonadaceae bacterium]|nr:DEAD/DEAH box helicase [Catalimonadaceae bacterium]
MISNFHQFGLSEEYVQVLDQQEITQPTPIQSQSIPALLEGKNILGLAQTGSGKTLAYGLPMLMQMDANSIQTQALVMCPTRELANQVASEIKKFTRSKSGLFTTPVYGGESIERQIKLLKQGSQIVIGTPGRIIDHLNRKTLNLSQCKYLVLDEADEMLSMGFEEDIRTIMDNIKGAQIALFSATMSRSVRQIGKQYLGEYQTVEIEKSAATKPNIAQKFVEVYADDKPEVMLRLIRFYGFSRCIAFCNTKTGTDKLVQQLADKGYMAEAIHGDMAQLQRTAVMRKFKTGQLPLLVATDVAARGIDVSNIEAVFNVDIPRDLEFYVHRIGRTGRAGKSGYSFSLMMKTDHRQLKQIERFTGEEMQREKVPSLQSIAYQKQAKVVEELRISLIENTDSPWITLVDQLEAEGHDIKMALAYLIGEKMGPVPPSEDLLLDRINREFKFADRDRKSGNRGSSERTERSEGGNSEGRHRGRPPGSPNRDLEKMVKLKFNIGRNAKIRPADLVGAIASEANVSGRRLGYIGIEEKYSTVDVPAELANKIVAAMKGNQVRGKIVKVELA